MSLNCYPHFDLWHVYHDFDSWHHQQLHDPHFESWHLDLYPYQHFDCGHQVVCPFYERLLFSLHSQQDVYWVEEVRFYCFYELLLVLDCDNQ